MPPRRTALTTAAVAPEPEGIAGPSQTIETAIDTPVESEPENSSRTDHTITMGSSTTRQPVPPVPPIPVEGAIQAPRLQPSDFQAYGVTRLMYDPNTRRAPPEFSSSTRNWEQVKSWVFGHERWHQTNQVADDFRTVVSSAYLKGSASVWYSDLPAYFHKTGNTWDEFVRLFRDRWSEVNWETRALEKFNSYQQTGTIDQYTNGFEQLYQAVRGHMSEFAAIERFIGGLKPKTKADVRRQGPKSLADAISYAAQADDINAPSSSRDNTKSLFGMNRTNEGSSNQRKRSRSQGRGKDTRKCYNCDKTGHLARDCRAPKKRGKQKEKESAPSASSSTSAEEKDRPRS
jgi:hypothetical protein